MDTRWCPSRRRLLATQWSVITLAALAGCGETGDEGSGSDNRDTTVREPTEDDDTSSSGDTDDGGRSETETIDSVDAGDLDLREANVVDVSFRSENGTYAFDVTLHHDDEGEDGYANWWQVERLDGTRLGRRDLLHAHSQQPFTRSETIEIPEDVTCVVVRGHDQTHGYGGLAAVIELISGDSRLIDQGPEKRAFDARDCP